MRKFTWLMMVVAVFAMASFLPADVITGNHTASFSSWDGVDSGAINEDGRNGTSPVPEIQNITVTNGKAYQVESITATYKRTWQWSGWAGDIHIYIIPGKISTGTFSDVVTQALGHASFESESLPYDTWTTRTVDFDSAFEISAGDYHIEWRMDGLPAPNNDYDQTVRIARDGGNDTYLNGLSYDEGYRHAGTGSWVVDDNVDLFFDINGSAVPVPATIILLCLGAAGVIRRR